jgi:chromosome segregation protein
VYLKRLEILGFKSFQQKTVVNFNHGLTAIVGPNGCGKTNIVDAIRWSLGEQKSSTLRSDKMENVIFNGTSSKKPMGMAEVSLTIENDKGILPTEFSEVTIARRIFRSGESEYLLNKNLCRLKDITNLFMDTGMGSNAYSVIELKMVETILSNRADERRVMFEEAAGVNKYKLRRRLTLKKLDDVKTDLTRVNDIVSEVEKKVSSLERQAKRADKHNALATSLRELEIELIERENALYEKEKGELKLKREEVAQSKIQCESELVRLDDEINEIKVKLNEIEVQLGAKRNEITENTARIHSLQQKLSVTEERRKSVQQNIDKYTQEIEELNNEILNIEETIEESKGKLTNITNQISEKEKEKEELIKLVSGLKENLEAKKINFKKYSDESLQKFKEITTKESELTNTVTSLNRTNSEITTQNERIQNLTGNMAKTVGYLEELQQDKQDVEKKLAEAEEFYAEKQREKEELEKRLNELKGEELKETTGINSVKEKIQFLQNLIDNLEGFSKGAKALLENEGWNRGEKNLLANIGDADDEYRFAIEAALKNNLNNILVESIEEVKRGVEYLQMSNFGKASFYIYSNDQDAKSGFSNRLKRYFIKRKKNKAAREPGFINWAENVIKSEERWKPFFRRILKDIVVADTLENAFAIAKKYPEYRYATLNGDFIEASGVIEGGSAPKLDDTLLGRKQLLETLRKEVPARQNNLSAIIKKIEYVEKEIGQIDLRVLSEKGRILINDLANVEKQIGQFEYEKKKTIDEIEKTRGEVQNLIITSNKQDNERESLSQFLTTKKGEKEAIELQREKYEEEVRVAETEYNQHLNRANRLNLELERLAGERKNADNVISFGYESLDNARKSIAKRENDITKYQEELITLEAVADENSYNLDGASERGSVLEKEKEEIDAGYREVKGRINNLELSQKKFRDDREGFSNQIHSFEIRLRELDMKIENIKEHLKENYSLPLELKAFDDNETFDFEARTDQVQQLKTQIKNLGPINLLAYSEFEEERARMEFLQKQRNDLLESEKDLAKTIEEINATAQKLFSETFEKIRTNFIKIFGSLFNPGDEADLKLEEFADPLEGKIEIIAKPKGKRPTSIELLSGGEKTLTAIALLFAIYLVKPSPFCILDEIDAPLDDANVDRFTKILKEFSINTQFVVVTHNKRTMEACETLYGVTMQEEGVSKLVSVRFNEDVNIVA